MTTIDSRTCFKVPNVYLSILLKHFELLKSRQPLFNEQNGWPQHDPLFTGFTIIHRDISLLQTPLGQVKLSFLHCNLRAFQNQLICTLQKLSWLQRCPDFGPETGEVPPRASCVYVTIACTCICLLRYIIIYICCLLQL